MRITSFAVALVLVAVPATAQDKRDPMRDAIDWLVRHQSRDGSWSVQNYINICPKEKCAPNPGHEDFDVGVSALACLAILSSGADASETEKALRRGVEWLIKQQGDEGNIGSKTAQRYLYNHCVATLALAEAGRAIPAGSKQPEDELRRALTRAVAFLLEAQNKGAAWRYTRKGGDNDMSVTAWAVQALAAAKRAGEKLPDAALKDAVAWIASVTDEKGKTGYTAKGTGKVFVPGLNEHFDDHPMMTAAAGLCRALVHEKVPPDSVKLVMGDLPSSDELKRDACYWHYGTRFVFAAGGSANWEAWKAAVTKALTDTQQQSEGCKRGSWEPEKDRWGGEGGRVYLTALNAMTLAHLGAPAEKPPGTAKWTFVLKGGGKVRAESYEEKGDVYVAKLPGGGTATIKKTDVDRIDPDK